MEIPAMDLVLYQPVKLLGDRVHARFGAEFPIRFDLLDTMGGGNLSLQVHPLTEYIQDQFGMHYTQDESYYILDAGDDACVYLGVKKDVDRDAMFHDLEEAREGKILLSGRALREPDSGEEARSRSDPGPERSTVPERMPWCWKSAPRLISLPLSCGTGAEWAWTVFRAPSI